MLKLLIRKFVKNHNNVADKKVREAYSVLAGVMGIVCNVFLFVLKLIAGLSVNSIAIISDAFNNLSDTGSAFVTVIGAKMSNKRADREHPYGHGRVEYVSSLVVSFIIILVGVEILQSSVGKIISPEPVSINFVMLVILILSLLVKAWMYYYNKSMGNAVNSPVLKAAAIDSINDVIATSAVIIASYVGQFFPSVPLDGIIGVLVSLLIIKSGFGIAAETVNTLLGSSPDAELVKSLENCILESEGIVGVHDLMVHDYGPGRVIASVHAEVPDNSDIVKIHEVIDSIEKRIGREMGIELVIHMDPISVNCQATNDVKNMVTELAKTINPYFTIHDFHMSEEENSVNLTFDLVVPCTLTEKEKETALKQLEAKIKDADSRYNAAICVDTDFTSDK